MSEKMTTIFLPGARGFMDCGNKSRKEMITFYRGMAQRQRDEADKILNAADDQFVVEQHVGRHVRRNIVRL